MLEEDKGRALIPIFNLFEFYKAQMDTIKLKKSHYDIYRDEIKWFSNHVKWGPPLEFVWLLFPDLGF